MKPSNEGRLISLPQCTKSAIVFLETCTVYTLLQRQFLKATITNMALRIFPQKNQLNYNSPLIVLWLENQHTHEQPDTPETRGAPIMLWPIIGWPIIGAK